MPALCSSSKAKDATSGVCSAGLAIDRIAGGERCHSLAEEDREREVPRRDADEDAAPAPHQPVAFAGRSGHDLGREKEPRLAGVVAAEVGRLAHLGDAVVERLAALAGHQRHQCVAFAFDRDRRAGRARRRVSRAGTRDHAAKPALGRRHDLIDRFNRQVHHTADNGLSIDGADDRTRRARDLGGGQRARRDRRRRRPWPCRKASARNSAALPNSRPREFRRAGA